MKKPNLYVMVGVPGAGKTWYIDNVLKAEAPNAVVISTDNYVEQYASNIGETYDEVFQRYMPTAVELMIEDVNAAKQNNLDIIWDQTSVSVATRRKKLRMLSNYNSIAIVLETPNSEELQKRLKSRKGKSIPPQVVHSMITSFVLPTIAEGFSEIRIIKGL